MKKVTLELGGKTRNIVFDDAEFEASVMDVISGLFAATGQTCIAGSRALVHRSIHDACVERLIEVAGSATIGDPTSYDTHVGPVTGSGGHGLRSCPASRSSTRQRTDELNMRDGPKFA